MSKLEQRKKGFKSSSFSADVSRVQARKQLEKDRKEKRNSVMLSKRVRPNIPDETEQLDSLSVHDALQQLKSPDRNQIILGLKQLRANLGSARPATDEIVSAGAVTIFCSLLNEPNDVLRLEAVWCLTNIASGSHDQTAAVLHAVPNLIHLLSSDTSSEKLKEQICWTIGNIAGDSDQFREVLMANGSVHSLVRFLLECVGTLQQTSSSNISSIIEQKKQGVQTAAWALSNLARGAISAHTFVTHESMHKIIQLLSAPADAIDDIAVSELCWLFAFLTAKTEQCVDVLLALNLVPGLAAAAARLQPYAGTVQPIPVIRCIGNLSSGPSHWLDTLLVAQESAVVGFLCACTGTVNDAAQAPAITVFSAAVLSSAPTTVLVPHRAVRKEALWGLGNMLSGSDSQRAQVLSFIPFHSVATTAAPAKCYSGVVVLDRIVSAALCDEFDIQREGVFALESACFNFAEPSASSMVLNVLIYGGSHFDTSSLSAATLLAPSLSLSMWCRPLLNALLNLLKLQTDSDVVASTIRLFAAFTSHSEAVMRHCTSIGLTDALDELQYGSTNQAVGSAAAFLVEQIYSFMESHEEETNNVSPLTQDLEGDRTGSIGGCSYSFDSGNIGHFPEAYTISNFGSDSSSPRQHDGGTNINNNINDNNRDVQQPSVPAGRGRGSHLNVPSWMQNS